MRKDFCASHSRSLQQQMLVYSAAIVAAAGAAFSVQQGLASAAVLLGVLAVEAMKYGYTGSHITPAEALVDGAALWAFAAAGSPGMAAWQAPRAWADLVRVTSPVAAAAALAYLCVLASGFFHRRRHIAPASAVLLVLTPCLFNWLLLLQAPELLERLGSLAAAGIPFASDTLQYAGRAIVLVAFNEGAAIMLFLSLAGRILTQKRMHALLVIAALYAAFTPRMADWGSGSAAGALHPAAGVLVSVIASVLSQAGLWAQTFLITGIIMDGLHGRRPVWYWGRGHFYEGLTKGAIYSAVFTGLIHAAAGMLRMPVLIRLAAEHPVFTGAAGGIIAFPLLKTIVESFDGSLPFFTRLRNNYQRYDHCLRGAAAGAGVGWALAVPLSAAGPGARFLWGFGIGAAAYGAMNVVRDCAGIVFLGRRLRLQAFKIYAAEAFMGGFAGGALAWYFDAAQTAVIAAKFRQYAAVCFAGGGIKIEDYVIYPLLSKWGSRNLGTVTGGAGLFYRESLSGVINWSLAAPLFSINLVVMTALFRRTLDPLKELFTRKGLTGLAEQAFRVQRWGLWMAPVIYSFLRMSPDPTWYNQDGAVRTGVATAKSLTLSPAAFRAWSLDTFTGLLAYDWLRIAIYVDHMCLRVATLVNFSFVGADVIDEKMARFFGHSVRTRVIPQGLRRFITWAPLLIPFYIPRGSDWNHAWDRAAALAAARPGVLFFPLLIAGVFAACAAAAGVVLLRRTLAKSRSSSSTPAVGSERTFGIGNGLYRLNLSESGLGWSRVFSSVTAGTELDITRRPYDPLQQPGRFFSFNDLDGPGTFWSLFRQPSGCTGPDYSVTQPDRSCLHVVNTREGIRAEAVVSIDCSDSVERWSLRLHNMDTRPRTLHLTSYREFALNYSDACLRHPDYNNIHVGTWFVPALSAVIARNRLLKTPGRDPAKKKLSPEVAFHGAGCTPGGHAMLTGYEDSRQFFLGTAGACMPAGLNRAFRPLSDDGLLYSFDPCAALRMHVSLAPGAETELLFVDGYAESMERAAALLQKNLGLRADHHNDISASLQKRRVLHGFNAPGDAEGLTKEREKTPNVYQFCPDGTELTVAADTPRPWGHVFANEQGYGVFISNHGEMYSFMGNSQQNGITPFSLNTFPVEVPGQVLYVRDMATGEVNGPTAAPFDRRIGSCSVRFGRGYAVFNKEAGETAMELVLCVLPCAQAEVRLLTIRNRSSEAKTYRVVPYFQMMLGETPQDTLGKVRAWFDDEAQAVFSTNPDNEFYRGYAFTAMSLPVEAYETVRSRFLGGPGRDFAYPFLVEHGMPDHTVADDGYAAAALAGSVTVGGGCEKTIVHIIGQTETMEQARSLIGRLRHEEAAREACASAKTWWMDLLSVLRVETSDPAFDRLVNDWLPYQVYTSHLWGRLGPYQRSGGYGYRDQLQAVLPLLHINPSAARSQILLHAGQQFFYGGDVLQWWHKSYEGKSGLGARNRASDPHLWLPYLVCRYVEATGDRTILDEEIAFLERRRIPRDREGVMFSPRTSPDTATLYVHCMKAIDLTLGRMGSRGLPLMGSGDWNDGLNFVGSRGRGESVWLGFFLYDILTCFAGIAGEKEGKAQKRRLLDRAARLRHALDAMWRDGRYVRAVADSGEELIFADALTAAWPALSGAADSDRAALAVACGLAELEKDNLVLLLAPPFTESSRPFPGRIADYPPGIRENGGQYSHGASWLVDALVRLAEMADEKKEHALAGSYRDRAYAVWRKISPLAHTGQAEIMRYGLAPHQQPADIYYGYGCEGRGGWSWYTGAAARMLSAAYGLLGATMKNGKLTVSDKLFREGGPLQLKRVVFQGREVNVKVRGET